MAKLNRGGATETFWGDVGIRRVAVTAQKAAKGLVLGLKLADTLSQAGFSDGGLDAGRIRHGKHLNKLGRKNNLDGKQTPKNRSQRACDRTYTILLWPRSAFFERYGVKGQFGIKAVYEKSAATRVARYGTAQPMDLAEVRKRVRETCLRLYGVETPLRKIKPQHHKSKIATSWLDQLHVPLREHWLRTASQNVKVDGFNPEINMVYEFYGDYWHGNPLRYPADMYNPQAHKMMGELYLQTLQREELILAEGYSLTTIWELEYRTSEFNEFPTPPSYTKTLKVDRVRSNRSARAAP